MERLIWKAWCTRPAQQPAWTRFQRTSPPPYTGLGQVHPLRTDLLQFYQKVFGFGWKLVWERWVCKWRSVAAILVHLREDLGMRVGGGEGAVCCTGCRCRGVHPEVRGLDETICGACVRWHKSGQISPRAIQAMGLLSKSCLVIKIWAIESLISNSNLPSAWTGKDIFFRCVNDLKS